MLLKESLFIVAVAAQNTLLVADDKVVPCFCVQAMTASTANPSVEEANFPAIGQRKIVASGFSHRYLLIIHTYGMVGHVLPASCLLFECFVVGRDCYGNTFVTAKTVTRLGIKSAEKQVGVSNREGQLRIYRTEMSLCGKLPMRLLQ
jgi:hypothetical protein